MIDTELGKLQDELQRLQALWREWMKSDEEYAARGPYDLESAYIVGRAAGYAACAQGINRFIQDK